jgi:hypothetical protein
VSGLSRRELLAAAGAGAGAVPLPAQAAVLGSPLTLIADRAMLPPAWAGRALVLEPGTFLDDARLAALPAGPAAAALMPANALLLTDLLRVRRRPLIWRAGLQHFTLSG